MSKTASSVEGGRSPATVTPPSPTASVRIVAEIFQDYNELGYRQSLAELDAAAEQKCQTIVVEPHRLGDETARWIAVGNALHKGAVTGGLFGALAVGLPRSDRAALLLGAPLCTVSLGCWLVYTLSWRADPLAKYQLDLDREYIASLNLNSVSSGSVMVLRLVDDRRRQILHNTVVAVAAVVLGIRLYSIFAHDI